MFLSGHCSHKVSGCSPWLESGSASLSICVLNRTPPISDLGLRPLVWGGDTGQDLSMGLLSTDTFDSQAGELTGSPPGGITGLPQPSTGAGSFSGPLAIQRAERVNPLPQAVSGSSAVQNYLPVSTGGISSDQGPLSTTGAFTGGERASAGLRHPPAYSDIVSG